MHVSWAYLNVPLRIARARLAYSTSHIFFELNSFTKPTEPRKTLNKSSLKLLTIDSLRFQPYLDRKKGFGKW